ncbi:hypothetical protein BDF14DRAFT_1719518, partial [Spinellus fusiger]
LALVASTCSTSALHFLLSPYIHTIELHISQGKTLADPKAPLITPNSIITLRTLDLLAQYRLSTLCLKDLVPAPGMFSTWRVSKKIANAQQTLKTLHGTPPTLPQTRFWLDQRGAAVYSEEIEKVMHVIQEHDRRQRLI